MPFSWRTPGPPEIRSRESDHPSDTLDTPVVHEHIAMPHDRYLQWVLRWTASHNTCSAPLEKLAFCKRKQICGISLAMLLDVINYPTDADCQI